MCLVLLDLTTPSPGANVSTDGILTGWSEAAIMCSLLLGRDRELAILVAACRAASAGRGSTTVVAGEPGIGKTALLAAVATSDLAARVLRATGVEAESAVAFATLQALLWPLRDGLDELERGQAALLQSVLELGPSVSTSTFAIGAAVLGLLSSCDEPLVAIVDDAHWSDVASQEALGFVGRRLEHERVALLVGVRTGATSLFDDRSFVRVDIAGLDAGAARSLLAQASPNLAAPVAEQLLEACAGNPLGLLELPSVLTEGQREGIEPLPAALEAGPLVQRAFAARAAVLSDAARSALLLLAASGDAQTALAAIDADERIALVDGETAGLISRRGRPRFRHPLVKSAVYGAAAGAERRAAHRRLAAVSEGARRAWHLAAAADGPDEGVAQALEAVAVQAGRSGGVAAQAQALERAAAMTSDERRADRLLVAGQAWRRAGRIEHARELLGRALDLATDDDTRGRIQLERGLNRLRALSYREAYELLSAEASRAAKTDPALAARLYAAVTLVANVYREAPPALASAEEAVRLAGRRGDEVELEALFALVSARMSRGLPPDDEDDEAVTRAAELLDKPELRTGEQPHWIAYSLAELERDEQARTLSDLALGEARAAGDVWSLCYGLYARAAVELVGGRLDAARTWAAEALPLAEQIGERWRLEQAQFVRVEIEGMRGSLATREDARVPSLAAGETPGAPDAVVALHLGRSLLALGRFEEATALLEVAAREFSAGTPRAWYRFITLDLAEAFAATRRRADAEVLVRDAVPGIEGCRLVRPRARLARVRALLAPERAIDVAFAQALVLLEEVPHVLEHARIELCWGERLWECGRSGEAVPQLEHALARFDALGAVGWSERARRALEAATGSRRPIQPRRTDVLTAQELRVARHAAGGMRDREIAASLYLSPRTVESYLQSAYRKLGVSNRTQLAGVLAAEGISALAAVAKNP